MKTNYSSSALTKSCRMTLTQLKIEQLFSRERLSTYVAQCDGDFDAGVRLYQWNAAVAAAFWEPVGHLEVALRNALHARLTGRHLRLSRDATWLDDPSRELTGRSRQDISVARARVRRKGKRVDAGQTISELGFGFWRFLIAKKLTGIWPDLAGAFPHAPDRRRETIEAPLARLHDFRNRLAHHQRIWNRDPAARYEDLLLIAGYLDADLPTWIDKGGSIMSLLTRAPVRCAPVQNRLSESEAIELGVNAVHEARRKRRATGWPAMTRESTAVD